MAQCSSLHIPSHQYIQWLFCPWSTERHIFQHFWYFEMHVSFKMTSQWRWGKANCTWAVQTFMNHFTNCLDYFTFITHLFPFLLRLLSWMFSSLTFWVPVLQSLPFRWALSAWQTCVSGGLPVPGMIGSFGGKLLGINTCFLSVFCSIPNVKISYIKLLLNFLNYNKDMLHHALKVKINTEMLI